MHSYSREELYTCKKVRNFGKIKIITYAEVGNVRDWLGGNCKG